MDEKSKSDYLEAILLRLINDLEKLARQCRKDLSMLRSVKEKR